MNFIRPLPASGMPHIDPIHSRSTTPPIDPIPEPQPLPPFDDPDADVIICSCEGIKFRTYKSNLTQVSPVMKTMFTLPQSSAAAAEDMEDGVPVVRLEETWIVLDIVLRHCLPRSALSQPESLPLTMRVLNAAKKYEMDWTPAYVRVVFDSLLVKQPVHAYLLACLYCYRDEAQLAARACLRLPTSVIANTCLEEFEGVVSLSTLQGLIQYRLACREVVVNLLKSWKWMNHYSFKDSVSKSGGSAFWFSNSCCFVDSPAFDDPAGQPHRVQKWWARFMSYTRERAEDVGCEDVVVREQALKFFMTDGSNCSRCRSSSHESISAFTKLLSNAIQEGLRKVSGCSSVSMYIV
ncbi:hypothetical protein PHLCEN_2v9272 [Hermanssonia centrifuga]|uniref:BTB domain-containing protein n=1 Tax=Hermanssonia centrifuga TaxID=98765 RepID=A0A2R6NRA9_9APHY|nr:hypothetical protein PHLCEN_2v9272 [Hermanssonia centrifuga]